MGAEKIYDEYSELEEELQRVFDKIISENDLPQNTFSYERSYSTKGKNKGELVSCGVYIHEMKYPPVKSTEILVSLSVLRHKEVKKGKLEFLIRYDQFDRIEPPETALVKEMKDTTYRHIVFDVDDPALMPYLEKHISYCLENYQPSNVFACCSKYKECSDEKKCIHPNFLYAKGCQYRDNLEAGRIFY